MPKNLSSVAEAMTAFMQVMGSVKESLRKILIRGEYDEYPEDVTMHCTARLAEMLDELSVLTKSAGNNEDIKLGNFLMEEIRVLQEAKGIVLPNFLSRSAFLTVLQRKVQGISEIPVEFMIKETVQMEMYADYSCDREYVSAWNRLMLPQDTFLKIVEGSWTDFDCVITEMEIEGLGMVDLGHLKNYKHLAQQAFDMKMRMMSYWKIVLERLVDSMSLYLLFSIQNLVNNDLELEIVNQMIGYGGGIERMLEESPSVAGKREQLHKSISYSRNQKRFLLRSWIELQLLSE
ncbi:hypothetical protein BVRB_4g080880 [Beta vulgaris subsp. vulgaris]|nr:hypothetical protein BVRB_4g080880 [Beta vulgaris subsp. vulgaris]